MFYLLFYIITIYQCHMLISKWLILITQNAHSTFALRISQVYISNRSRI